MLPLTSLQQKAMTLLGHDTASFQLNGNGVTLVPAAFTPGDAFMATFPTQPTTGGLGTLEQGADTPQTTVDPATGQIVTTIFPPVGGWRWVSSDTVGLPVTIHGFVYAQESEGTVLACQLFDVPITITASGQEITIPEVAMRLPFGVIN